MIVETTYHNNDFSELFLFFVLPFVQWIGFWHSTEVGVELVVLGLLFILRCHHGRKVYLFTTQEKIACLAQLFF